MQNRYQEFQDSGVVFIPSLIDAETATVLHRECLNVLHGDYSLGVVPDKVKWRPGDSVTCLRSVCNAWKSSRVIRDFIFSNKNIGKIARAITGWQSVRLNQDAILLVPDGASGVTFHQDDAYQDWIDPPHIVTCWISLTSSGADSSGLLFASGSHAWGLSARVETFADLDDPEEPLRNFARENSASYRLDRFHYSPGDATFHDGRLFHGSDFNSSGKNRCALALHLMAGQSCFSGVTSPYFSRYRLGDSDELHEAFFPFLK